MSRRYRDRASGDRQSIDNLWVLRCSLGCRRLLARGRSASPKNDQAEKISIELL